MLSGTKGDPRMSGNVRNRMQAKERRLLQLYSLWQETRSGELQKRCLGLLRELMSIDPAFSLRREFQEAF